MVSDGLRGEGGRAHRRLLEKLRKEMFVSWTVVGGPDQQVGSQTDGQVGKRDKVTKGGVQDGSLVSASGGVCAPPSLGLTKSSSL